MINKNISEEIKILRNEYIKKTDDANKAYESYIYKRNSKIFEMICDIKSCAIEELFNAFNPMCLLNSDIQKFMQAYQYTCSDLKYKGLKHISSEFIISGNFSEIEEKAINMALSNIKNSYLTFNKEYFDEL